MLMTPGSTVFAFTHSQALRQGHHLQAIGFHPVNNYIWGIGYMSLMQDPPFGLLAFTPKRHSIWVWANYVLCRILLRVIGLHPEAKHGYMWK